MNFRVPAQQDVIGQNDIVPQSHVVSQMCAHHQEVVRADSRVTALFGAPMNRAVFTDNIVVTNLDPGSGLRIEAEILRIGADHTSVPDPVVLPDHHRTGDHRVALNLCTGRNPNVAFDQRVGANHHAGINFRVRIDHCRGVNHPDFLA